jgi:hypothetical protein
LKAIATRLYQSVETQLSKPEDREQDLFDNNGGENSEEMHYRQHRQAEHFQSKMLKEEILKF